jgi:hypothetical protein
LIPRPKAGREVGCGCLLSAIVLALAGIVALVGMLT